MSVTASPSDLIPATPGTGATSADRRMAACLAGLTGPGLRILLLCLPILHATAAPLLAGTLLSDAQMDAVSAGRVVATASADATATGNRPLTATETSVLAQKTSLDRVTLRRISNGTLIADSAEVVEADIGYARAAARATGTDPAVSCQADLAFTQPVTYRLAQRQRLTRPTQAGCLCARFGVSVLPN